MCQELVVNGESNTVTAVFAQQVAGFEISVRVAATGLEVEIGFGPTRFEPQRSVFGCEYAAVARADELYVEGGGVFVLVAHFVLDPSREIKLDCGSLR